jgi:hypothetical protein
MSVMMVRAKVKEERVGDVEAAAKKVFASLDDAGPDNIGYASLRLPDGVSFVVLLALEDPADNPLPALPAYQELEELLKGALAEPPVVDQLTVIGSYGLFG